jgi:hypothetical protein
MPLKLGADKHQIENHYSKSASDWYKRDIELAFYVQDFSHKSPQGKLREFLGTFSSFYKCRYLHRLVKEVDKNRQAVNEINSLQRSVMQRDRELTESKLAMQKPIGDLDLLSKEFNCILREKEDAKRR